VTLRSLWAHKRRLVSTVVSIVLGVAFMTGTFILSSTLDRVYNDLYENTLDDVDAVVRGALLYQDPFFVKHFENVPVDLLTDVSALSTVAEAQPRVTTADETSANRLLGSDGTPIGAAVGPPTTFENWTGSEALSAYRLQDGRAPEDDDEVAINVGAAEEGEYEVGDLVTVVGKFGPQDYELVGVFTFGTAKSAAGAVSVDFTLPEAQRLGSFDGTYQEIWVDGAEGVTQQELVADLEASLPGADSGGLEVITGKEAVAELGAARTNNFRFLQTALTIFGAIALFVGIFVISNTFSILVAQRTRELALLRALGASREQVLGSMLLEALAVGLVSAAFGLVGGLGLAKVIVAALGNLGAELPSKSLVILPVTILLSLGIGVAITLVAAIVPALRATKVHPLAALRDVAVDRSNASRFRIGAGAVNLAVGSWLVSDSWRSGGHSKALPAVGTGSALLLIGSILVGPVLAAPTVRTFGSPLPRFRGVTGRLATENAARSPKRTSATASAVIIGVALVTFITVFAKSADASVDEEVRRIFGGDFIVQVDGLFGQGGGMPASVPDTIAEVDGVELVTAGGAGSGKFTYPDGDEAAHLLFALDTAGFGTILNPNLAEGDIEDLDDDGILVDRFVAKDHGIEIGDRITVETLNGTLEQTVQGISDDRNLLGLLAITSDAYRSIEPEALVYQVGGKIEPGADLDRVLVDIEDALELVPDVLVLDRDGFVGNLKQQINGFITVIYGLLMLSVVISLIGVANTLSLSINERTRELGLLRAIGMDRIDLRAAIRWEACLICLLGTVVGVGVGLLVGVALMNALSSIGLSTFAVPIVGVGVIIAAAAVLGTLASVRPARRGAALSILDAIATD
jgi:putative ABC transport system permease protein